MEPISKLGALSFVAGRLDRMVEGMLVDLQVHLQRRGYDEAEIAAALEEAGAVNRDAVRRALGTAEALLNRHGIDAVASLSFSGEPPPLPTKLH